MPKVTLYNIDKEAVGEAELSDFVFDAPQKSHLVHEVVRAALNSRRSGSANTKTRGDLTYSTRKLFRQKKTGNARKGSRRSPILKGGGTIFGPHPRDYGFTPPAKVRRAALRGVLSSKLEKERLTILDAFPISEIKTKIVYNALLPWNLRSGLIVIPEADPVLEKSAKNLPWIKVLRAEGLNCHDILSRETLIILKDSLPIIEERLGKK
jgi:large subunit ribosomal protein L4